MSNFQIVNIILFFTILSVIDPLDYVDAKTWMWLSMTTLLLHTFANASKHSFSSKAKNNCIKKFVSLAVTCIKVVKNCKILTYKVNFLCKSKMIQIFIFFSIEQYQVRNTFFLFCHFLTTLILKTLYLLKRRLIFDNFNASECKTKKFLMGLFLV